MAGDSSSTATFSKATKHCRRWVPEEDAALVSCMVDLHNTGRFNADTGVGCGFLEELERMLAQALPHGNLKAKAHIESRIGTLKEDWTIIYDMINGKNTSGFGWDDHRQMVTAEDYVWDTYIAAHPTAAQFKIRTFPFYKELTAIYAEDHATGEDAQKVADIIEELAAADEGHADSNSVEQCEIDLDDMDVSTKPPMSSKKRRRATEFGAQISAESIISAAKLLGDTIREVGKELSRSIGTDMIIQEKLQELDGALSEIEGLTEDERDIALSKIPDHPTQMLVFCSLLPDRKLAWVRKFLDSH